MATSFSRSITDAGRRIRARASASLHLAVVVAVSAVATLASCMTQGDGESALQDAVNNGAISYPFIDESKRLGGPGEDEGEGRFIIRSVVGDREYAIEIPGAARDYDVHVPLADLGEADADVARGIRPKSIGSAVATDREVVAALPHLDRDRAGEAAMMDGAFGVASPDGPRQAPSYTLGIAKINELFKKRQFEYALVELNNLVAFYPNSPLLQKMKGTLLLKMRNFELAQAAWTRAVELAPGDRALRAALLRLEKKLAANRPSPSSPAAMESAPAH